MFQPVTQQMIDGRKAAGSGGRNASVHGASSSGSGAATAAYSPIRIGGLAGKSNSAAEWNARPLSAMGGKPIGFSAVPMSLSPIKKSATHNSIMSGSLTGGAEAAHSSSTANSGGASAVRGSGSSNRALGNRPQSAASLQRAYNAFIVDQKRVGSAALERATAAAESGGDAAHNTLHGGGGALVSVADVSQLRVAQHLAGVVILDEKDLIAKRKADRARQQAKAVAGGGNSSSSGAGARRSSGGGSSNGQPGSRGNSPTSSRPGSPPFGGRRGNTSSRAASPAASPLGIGGGGGGSNADDLSTLLHDVVGVTGSGAGGISPIVAKDGLPAGLTASRRAQLLRSVTSTAGSKSTKVSRLYTLDESIDTTPPLPAPQSTVPPPLPAFAAPRGGGGGGADPQSSSAAAAAADGNTLSTRSGATADVTPMTSPRGIVTSKNASGVVHSSSGNPATSAPYYASSTAPAAKAARGVGMQNLLLGAAGGEAAPTLAAQVEDLFKTVEEAWWGSAGAGAGVGSTASGGGAANANPFVSASAIAAGISGGGGGPIGGSSSVGGLTDPSERCASFFRKTKAVFEALSLCVPRLQPLLTDAAKELEVSERYMFALNGANRNLRRQLAAQERSAAEQLQEVRYASSRNVQSLAADLDKKGELLAIANKTCDALRARLDATTEGKKAASEQLRTYQTLCDRGRMEAVSLTSQVQQLQDRSNNILVENRFLRELADHNTALLRDIQVLEERVKELKKDNAALVLQQITHKRERDEWEERARRRVGGGGLASSMM